MSYLQLMKYKTHEAIIFIYRKINDVIFIIIILKCDAEPIQCKSYYMYFCLFWAHVLSLLSINYLDKMFTSITYKTCNC